MSTDRYFQLAIDGVIAKAANIARIHGQRAYGREARVLADFIAIEIEAIADPCHNWEEREAWMGERDAERARQDQDAAQSHALVAQLSGETQPDTASPTVLRATTAHQRMEKRKRIQGHST